MNVPPIIYVPFAFVIPSDAFSNCAIMIFLQKAGGDIKIKGKPDPFAYIPLERGNLNKR